MGNKKCQYCGRPLAGEICPAHGYVGKPLPATPLVGLTGATGNEGSPGLDGITWYSGIVVPDESLGVEGDFYLNTENGDLYRKL